MLGIEETSDGRFDRLLCHGVTNSTFATLSLYNPDEY